jgi:hypothetical protein
MLLVSVLLLIVLGFGLTEFRAGELAALDGDRGVYWQGVNEELEAIGDTGAYQRELDHQTTAFMQEVFLQLEPDLYFEMPFLRYMKTSLVIRTLCGLLLGIGGFLLFFRKRFAWKMLMVACSGTILASGLEGFSLSRFLPDFWNVLRIDVMVVHQDLVDEVGPDGFWMNLDLRFLESWQGNPLIGPVWIGIAAAVPFLLGVVLALPVVRRGLTGAADSAEMQA